MRYVRRSRITVCETVEIGFNNLSFLSKKIGQNSATNQTDKLIERNKNVQGQGNHYSGFLF